MNRNTTAIILIVLAVGIYFTLIRPKMAEIQTVRAVNKQYQDAIDNSVKLVEVRDSVLRAYNSVSESDRERLNKLIPDNVDNVRLIIDVKDDIAARHGLALKNIKTASPEAPSSNNAPIDPGANSSPTVLLPTNKFGTVTLSFSVTSAYDPFINFLKDLEASLRIMDVTKLKITANDVGTYDFDIEIKTYWLKQN
jgi:Tfp pilus assembly protein PilO